MHFNDDVIVVFVICFLSLLSGCDIELFCKHSMELLFPFWQYLEVCVFGTCCHIIT